MPQFLKHVGQIDSSGKKCVVVFRQIPGEEDSCLVAETETLPQNYHDDLIVAVESVSAQETMDFYKYAGRANFHDGRNMLEALHLSGWLKKLPTGAVTMLPTPEINIKLSELNQQLSSMEQDGKTTSGDINQEETPMQTKSEDILDDANIALQLRKQADYFMKEAQRLQKEADELEGRAASSAVPVAENTTSEPKAKRKYTRKK